MLLEHLQAVRDFGLLAHDEVASQLSVLLEVRRRQELADHPVTHLLVVSGNSDEGRLNETALDADERCKKIELALDLVDRLPLVGDDSQHRGEVAGADLGEHLQCGLLLLARNEVLSSLAQCGRGLGQLVAQQ